MSITLRDVGSWWSVPLWTAGPNTVSVLLTVSFRNLWLIWKRQVGEYKQYYYETHY